jgi:predicted nucleic acid-binding Zn ribbon protein
MVNNQPQLEVTQEWESPDIVCADCGKAFTIKRQRHPDRGYVIGGDSQVHLPVRCPKCKAYKRYVRKRGRGEDHQWQCETCGAPFGGRKRRFCPSCRNVSPVETPTAQVCVVCGASFISRPDNKTCSRACRDTYHRQIARERATKRLKVILDAAIEPDLMPSGMHRDGAIAEAVFDAWCLRRAIVVMRPVIECQKGVDRVIRLEGEWHGVQVKKLHEASNQASVCGRHGDLLACAKAVRYVAAVNVTTGDVYLYDWHALGMPASLTPPRPAPP